MDILPEAHFLWLINYLSNRLGTYIFHCMIKSRVSHLFPADINLKAIEEKFGSINKICWLENEKLFKQIIQYFDLMASSNWYDWFHYYSSLAARVLPQFSDLNWLAPLLLLNRHHLDNYLSLQKCVFQSDILFGWQNAAWSRPYNKQ